MIRKILEALSDETVTSKILSDILSVTKYMNIGIVIALAYVVVYFVYLIICRIRKKERKITVGHAIAVFALVIYLTSLLFIVFVSREPGQFDGANLDLWSSWGITTRRKALFIENIIMFIPMGILLPSAFKKFRNPIVCVVSCALMSCFIEQTQFMFKLGFAEIDDVVTNTLGGALGWLIWGILWLIFLIISGLFKRKK